MAAEGFPLSKLIWHFI